METRPDSLPPPTVAVQDYAASSLWLSPSQRTVLVVFASGIFIGLAIYAAVGADQLHLDPTLQAALIAGTAAVLAGFAALIAARVSAAASLDGATLATEEARQQADLDRQAAWAAALRDRKVPLFEKVLDQAIAHEREVTIQVAWRRKAARGEVDLTKPPDVGETDPIFDAAHQLFAFARQDTADLAETLYAYLVELDGVCYDASIHYQPGPPPRVVGLTQDEEAAFRDVAKRVDDTRTLFIAAVRSELGLRALVAKPPGQRLPADLRELD
jgi:hypothetical protein